MTPKSKVQDTYQEDVRNHLIQALVILPLEGFRVIQSPDVSRARYAFSLVSDDGQVFIVSCQHGKITDA